jgi:nucleoside 2-deoxyribosyltransferase
MEKLLVMISGPVSSGSAEEEERNRAELNRIAAEVLKRGHVPLVGLNAARPVVELATVEDPYESVMRICEALADRCDAVLVTGESSGACREIGVFERKGLPIFKRLDELPAVFDERAERDHAGHGAARAD